MHEYTDTNKKIEGNSFSYPIRVIMKPVVNSGHLILKTREQQTEVDENYKNSKYLIIMK